MEGVQSEIVGEAASCPVVVQTSKSRMVWVFTIQGTE